MQNASTDSQLSENLIFVAGRNFCRQQIFHLWVRFHKNLCFLQICLSNLLPPEISAGNTFFWKVQDEEMHFAPSTVRMATFGADVGPFEVALF